MKSSGLAGVMLAVCMTLPPPAQAGIGSKVASELSEFVMKKFGKEVAAEGVEQLAGRLMSAAARHGDELIAAVQKVGPKAITLADEAGEHAPGVIRFLTRHGDDGLRVLSKPEGMALLARFGDDAAEVLVRHSGAAAPVLDRLGRPAIAALGAVGPRGGRRMAMMADDLAGSGHAAELLGTIGRFGDPAMEFLWRNKGILAGGAALTAFLANPAPFINGASDVTRAVAENAVKPAVVAAGDIAVETVSFVRQIVITCVVAAGVVIGVGLHAGAFRSGPMGLAFRLAGKRLVRCMAGRK